MAFRFDEPSYSKQTTKYQHENKQPKYCVLCASRWERFWVAFFYWCRVHPRSNVHRKGMRCNKIWIIKINVNDSFVRSLSYALLGLLSVCMWDMWWCTLCVVYTYYILFGLCFDLLLCEMYWASVLVWVWGRETITCLNFNRSIHGNIESG